MNVTSIIIVNYNTSQLTLQCIESVYVQTQHVVFEVIVVDNASTECDPEIFERKFPTIILIRSQTNLGFAGGNNLGLAVAKGEFVLLLNSDAFLKNNAIELSLQRMLRDPSIGVLSGKLVFPNGRLQFPAQRFETLNRELRELFRINKFRRPSDRAIYYLGDAFDHETEVFCDWVWGAFFFFRREVLEHLPKQKLPDDFFMYAEDVQWCYWIKKLGYRVLYFPDAEIIHLMGGSDRDTRSSDDKYFLRILPNRYRLLQIEHGKVYAFMVYWVRICHLVSLRNTTDWGKAKRYMRLILGMHKA